MAWIVLRGLNQSRGQAAQLFDTDLERSHIGFLPQLGIRCIEIACLPAPCRLSLHLSRVAAVGQWEILNLRLSPRENPCDYPPPPYSMTESTCIVSFLPLTGLHIILHFLPAIDFTLPWLAIWKT